MSATWQQRLSTHISTFTRHEFRTWKSPLLVLSSTTHTLPHLSNATWLDVEQFTSNQLRSDLYFYIFIIPNDTHMQWHKTHVNVLVISVSESFLLFVRFKEKKHVASISAEHSASIDYRYVKKGTSAHVWRHSKIDGMTSREDSEITIVTLDI